MENLLATVKVSATQTDLLQKLKDSFKNPSEDDYDYKLFSLLSIGHSIAVQSVNEENKLILQNIEIHKHVQNLYERKRWKEFVTKFTMTLTQEKFTPQDKKRMNTQIDKDGDTASTIDTFIDVLSNASIQNLGEATTYLWTHTYTDFLRDYEVFKITVLNLLHSSKVVQSIKNIDRKWLDTKLVIPPCIVHAKYKCSYSPELHNKHLISVDLKEGAVTILFQLFARQFKCSEEYYGKYWQDIVKDCTKNTLLLQSKVWRQIFLGKLTVNRSSNGVSWDTILEHGFKFVTNHIINLLFTEGFFEDNGLSWHYSDEIILLSKDVNRVKEIISSKSAIGWLKDYVHIKAYQLKAYQLSNGKRFYKRVFPDGTYDLKMVHPENREEARKLINS